MRRIKVLNIAVVAVLTFSAMMASCEENKKSEGEVQVFHLTDSLRKIVSVETVKNIQFEDELLLNGQVDCDPNKVAHVFPMFGGTVIRMGATVGDYVHRGQVLAVVRSTEVADYAKQMNDADMQISTARRENDALSDMYKGGMASERDLQQAHKTLKNAESERNRLSEIYRINHITGKSTFVVTAPISGFITEAHINPDMQIRPDQDEELFTIAGLDDVWVIANVYENDIKKVSLGATARISTLAYGDDHIYQGQVNKIYPILNEDSKTEMVKFSLNNKGYLLKPGMYAQVSLSVPSAGGRYPAVPTEAVIFDDDKHYVVTVDTHNVLSYKEVKLLKETATRDYVKQGLGAGERIIVHNALLVYNSLK